MGKSTLLLQVARYLSEAGQTVVYVAGEESPQQIKLRSERLGFSGRGVLLLSETDVDEVINRLEERQPSLAIFDSIQTMYWSGRSFCPGHSRSGAGGGFAADALVQSPPMCR